MGKKQHTIIVMSNGDIYSVDETTSYFKIMNTDAKLTGFLKFKDLKSEQTVFVNTANISSIIMGSNGDEQ